MENRELQKRNWIIFFVGLIGIVLFSIWKAKFGFGGKDVSFYLTTPYRIALGDKWFLDDWNLTQLSSFIIYPFVKLYITIVGNTEGIMISFRYIYILVNFVITIYIYSKLKEFGLSAIIAMWIYFLFVPFNNMMLSYNTMGMMFGFIACIIIAYNQTNSLIKYGVAGFFFAMTVLCQPLLAGVFIIGAIYILVKRRENKKYLGAFTIGCIIPAIPIFVYAFSVVGIKNIIENIPYMTMEMGVEHGFNGAINWLKDMVMILFPKRIYNIWGICVNSVYVFCVLYIVAILLIILFVVRKHKSENYKSFIKVILVYNVVYDLMAVATWKTNSINIVLLPIIIGGIVCYKYGDNAKLKILFKWTFLWGIAHIIGYLTSNGGMAVYSVALFPLSIISLVYVLYELRDDKIFIAISAMFIILSIIIIRGCALFQDKSIFVLDTRIKYGPAKNIVVEKEQKEEYDIVWKNAKILEKNGDKICILSAHTWMYLMMDKRTLEYGTYMPYTIELVLKNNGNYFKRRNVSPNIIYIDDEYAETMNLDKSLKEIGITQYRIEKMQNGVAIYVQ